MLKKSFCHIPSIGVKTEQNLWSAGARSWEDLLDANGSAALPLSKAKLETARENIRAGLAEFDSGNAAYFASRLPSREHWRLYRDFRDQAVCLDIETTGLGLGEDHITSIAMYDGQVLKTYVYGRNLEDFLDDVRDYALLVTFNGRCFDVPFIERSLGAKLGQAHLDLRFALKRAGIGGGLKRCEKFFGLDRGSLDGIDGYWAVLLWREFELTGDEDFLRTLLAYNAEDVLNLGNLAARAYNLLLQDTPFDPELRVDAPGPGLNPFEPSRKALAWIRDKYF